GHACAVAIVWLHHPARLRLSRGHRADCAEGEGRKSGGTAEGTLRLGLAAPAAERKPDDGHAEEEKEGSASRPETPGASAPTPAARVAAAPLHGRVVHRERPGQERRLVPRCPGVRRGR